MRAGFSTVEMAWHRRAWRVCCTPRERTKLLRCRDFLPSAMSGPEHAQHTTRTEEALFDHFIGAVEVDRLKFSGMLTP